MAQGSRRPVSVHRVRGLLGRYYLGIPIHRVRLYALLIVITSFALVSTGRPPGQSLAHAWPTVCRATSCGTTIQPPIRQFPHETPTYGVTSYGTTPYRMAFHGAPSYGITTYGTTSYKTISCLTTFHKTDSYGVAPNTSTSSGITSCGTREPPVGEHFTKAVLHEDFPKAPGPKAGGKQATDCWRVRVLPQNGTRCAHNAERCVSRGFPPSSCCETKAAR